MGRTEVDMWTCPKCQQEIEQQFDACWKCRTPKDASSSAQADQRVSERVDVAAKGTKLAKLDLEIAAWLSIVQAVLYIPLSLGAFVSMPTSQLAGVVLLLGVVSFALYVYTITTLRDLLHQDLGYHGVDRLISISIAVSGGMQGREVLHYFFPATRPSEGAEFVILAAILLVIGALTVVFGIQLLRLPANLYGSLRPFAYAEVIAGIFAVSIILAILIPFVAVAAYIALGLLFFRAAEKPTPTAVFKR